MTSMSVRFTFALALAGVLLVLTPAVFDAQQGGASRPASSAKAQPAPTSVSAPAGAALRAPAAKPASASQAALAAGAEAHLATVKQFCAGCHNDRSKMAGVSFEGLTPEGIAKHPDLFEKAVRKVRGRVMPPPRARQPEPAAVDSLVAWLERSEELTSELQSQSN